jgi:hypothetical protein
MANDDQVVKKPPAGEPSTGTSIDSPRKPFSWAAMITRLFEAIGLLNKGSAESAATPKADDAAQTAGVSSNTLNVTRVGGLTAFIAAAGAAALALFNVNKATDRASIVVAAYISVGVIVVAALLTAAIIISSDIRGRTAASTPTASPSVPTASTSSTEAETADANSFGDSWYRAVSMLHDAVDQLERTPVNPNNVWVDGSTAAWLDAAASIGKTQNLHPLDDDQAILHARLSAGQSSVVSLFDKLVNDQGSGQKPDTITRIRSVLNSIDRSLPWPN